MSSAGESLIRHETRHGVDFAERESEDCTQGVVRVEKENDSFQKDTKYSWFVCSCAFITRIFVLGVLHAYGVFFVEFIKEFKSSKGETAWIGSLAYGLSMTFGPVTSILVSKFGNNKVMMTGGIVCSISLLISSFMTSPSQLFMSFSILYGIGTCMCTSPTMTITPEYFDKYLSVATGITVSGSSFGTLIMGPLSQIIIDNGSWRIAFRVFSVFCLITCALNSRIRTPPRMKMRRGSAISFIRDVQIWKNRVFIVWATAMTLVMFGFYIPYVHLVSYAVDQGISQKTASMLMLVMGATTALGRIMFGKIVQYGFLNRIHMHQLSMLVTGTGVMILPLLKTFPMIVGYVFVVGLVDGCYVVLLPILTTSLMGIENSVLAWGFLIFFCSITFTLGPPAAGALYDMTGTYNVAFHCAGLPILTGAAVLFLIPWAQRTARAPFMFNMTTITANPDGNGTQEAPNASPTNSGEFVDHGSVSDDGDGVNLASASKVSAKSHTRSCASSYADKATATDDVVLPVILYSSSVGVIDALSQFSYKGEMVDEMLRRSRDNQTVSTAPSISTQDIPHAPQSSPVQYRRHDDGHDGVQRYVTVPSHTGSAFIGVRNPTNSPPGSVSAQQTYLLGSSSFTPGNSRENLPSASELFDLTSVYPTPSTSLQRPTTPTPFQPHPLSMYSIHSLVDASKSVSGAELVKERSNFDQAISEQVDLMRETLATPDPSVTVLDVHDPTPPGRNVNVSPSIPIASRPISPVELQQPVPSKSTILSEAAKDEPSASFLTKQILKIEAATRIGDKSALGEASGETESCSESDMSDTQLTVIAATSKQPGAGRKLEELFKPVVAETYQANKASPSVPVVDKPSQKAGKNQTEEIDVFTHLFDDEDSATPP